MEYIAATPAQLGLILKGRRKQRGLTQLELGQAIALNQNAVSNMELHTGSVALDRLYRLLSALGLELVIREKGSSLKSEPEW